MIKSELDFNQEEYKSKQSILLKQLEDIQNECPHDETRLISAAGHPILKCADCCKIINKEELIVWE